jgi:hypothetical protein
LPSTWLSRQMMVAEAGIEPAADEAYETPALPTELFRGIVTGCPSWVRTKPPRVQSPVPYQLGEGAMLCCGASAGFEPALPDLKGPVSLAARRTWPKMKRAARIEIASATLAPASGSAWPACFLHGWSTPKPPTRSPARSRCLARRCRCAALSGARGKVPGPLAASSFVLLASSDTGRNDS